MKKLVSLIVICGLFVWVVAPAFAASAGSVGFIDVQKIFKEYKATEKAQAEIKKEEEAFKTEFDASQKKLEDAKKANKSEKELKEMTAKFEKELTPKRDKLVGLSERLTAQIQIEIVNAVKDVSKTVGVDIVLDKQVIIVGGIDITDLVVNKLNQK